MGFQTTNGGRLNFYQLVGAQSMEIRSSHSIRSRRCKIPGNFPTSIARNLLQHFLVCIGRNNFDTLESCYLNLMVLKKSGVWRLLYYSHLNRMCDKFLATFWNLCPEFFMRAFANEDLTISRVYSWFLVIVYMMDIAYCESAVRRRYCYLSILSPFPQSPSSYLPSTPIRFIHPLRFP